MAGVTAVALAVGPVASSALAEEPDVLPGPAGEPLATTSLVSATPAGLPGDGDGVELSYDVSADGRTAVFSSWATDLVRGRTADGPGVFVRDLVTGRTRLVSSGAAGAGSGGGRISDDGRLILFDSTADLVPGGATRGAHALVQDLRSGAFELAGLSDDDVQVRGSSGLDISADGRFVLFSTADAAVTGQAGRHGLFVRDRLRGRTARMDLSSAGVAGNGPARFGGMSPNGRFVAFTSEATNLVDSDRPLCPQVVPPRDGAAVETAVPANCLDVFLRDRDPDADGVYDEPGATTVLVSVTDDERQANAHSGAGSGSVSDRGDVVFWSHAPNLGSTPPGEPGAGVVVVRDHRGGTRVVAEGASNPPSITPDGRHVAFDSFLASGVAEDTNGAVDAFLYDLAASVARRVGVAADGSQLPGSYAPVVTPDARHVLFLAADAASAPPGDGGVRTNLYRRDLGAVPPA